MNEIRDILREQLPALLSSRFQGISSLPTPSKWMASVYFLQQAYKVPLQYRFTMYSQGPHSPEVQRDLHFAESQRVVAFQQDPSRKTHTIAPGSPPADDVQEHWHPYQPAINDFMRDLGAHSPAQLTLRAATHAIAQTSTGNAPPILTLIQAVHELKPHVSHQEIREAINDLQQKHLLPLWPAT